jgi:hypothetical protein
MPVHDSRRAEAEEHARLPASCDLDFIWRSVGSRFVFQNELDDANARRDEQWRQASAGCIVSSLPTKYALNA